MARPDDVDLRRAGSTTSRTHNRNHEHAYRHPARHVALASATSAALADEVPAASTAPVPAGAYTVDKAHTSLVFRVSHLGFSTYTGRFTRLDANLQFDPAKLDASRVNVTIDPRSIEADNAPSGFLQSLAGKDWLDADRFPEMSFRTKSVEVTGPGTFRVNGELTCTVSRSRWCSRRTTTVATRATPTSRVRELDFRHRASSSVRISA